MFGSRTLVRHLLRGVVGFAALAAAFVLLGSHQLWSLSLLALSLLSLRGCPTCWTIGLFETLSGRASSETCADGSCAKASLRAP
jgi:hypothetical protein